MSMFFGKSRKSYWHWVGEPVKFRLMIVPVKTPARVLSFNGVFVQKSHKKNLHRNTAEKQTTGKFHSGKEIVMFPRLVS